MQGEDGFSYMETLVALLLLTILASGLSLFAIGLLKAPARILSTGSEIAAISRIDRELRRSTACITPPWWLSGPQAEFELTHVSVPWFEGGENRRLVLSITADSKNSQFLRITTDTQAEQFSLPSGYSGRFASIPRGMELILETPGNQILIQSSWGSRSISGGTNE